MPNVTVTVDPSDLASLQQKLETIARPALERILMRAGPYAQQQASAAAPRQTGALAHSITSSVHGLEMRVSSALPYAMPVEFGRRAGAPMPPVSAFRRYGEFAFPIARAIARRGIKGRFFMRRARELLWNSEIPRLLRVAVDEIEAVWARR